MNPDVKASEKAIAVATGQKPQGRDRAASVAGGRRDPERERRRRRGRRGDRAPRPDRLRGRERRQRRQLRLLPHPGAVRARGPQVARPRRRRWPTSSATPSVEPAPASEPLTTMLRVIVGKTFQGTLGPGSGGRHAGAADAPRSSGPTARSRRRSAPLRKRLDFPIMVPTVRENSSSIDDDEGIRVYKIDDNKALRLTYHTGSNEYWGIQQTSWEDPPILDEPDPGAHDRRAQLQALLQRPEAAHRRVRAGRGRLLGREHAPEQALERDDARDRQGPEAPRARASGPAVEAIILAGGKAERLGAAAGGRPKALVDVAGTAARRLPGGAARPGRRRRACS